MKREPPKPPIAIDEAKSADILAQAAQRKKKARAGDEVRAGEDDNQYELRDDGLYWHNHKRHGLRAWDRISPYVEVKAIARTLEGRAHGVVIEFDNGEERRVQRIVRKATLYKEGSEALIDLIDSGFHPSPDAAQMQALRKYLLRRRPDLNRIFYTSRVGWHRGSFVLPDETIAAPGDSESIVFHAEDASGHRFHSKGTLTDWRECVARPCAGNSRLQLAVSAAFAAPLLHLAGLENSGFHFKGTSGHGKTTAQYVAGSVCGGGDAQHGFVQSWRATSNGLEAQAALHNDCLLALNEIAQVPAKELSDVVYCLGNGQGKSRATKTGQSQANQSFRLLALSSGETSIDDIIDSAGGQIRGGHDVRLIQIPADAGGGFYLFENLHGSASGDEFAKRMTGAAFSYYGTALREFLKQVLIDVDAVKRCIREQRDHFVDAHCPMKASTETRRKLHTFGHVGAAGELASAFGLTGWPAGEAMAAAAQCFRDHFNNLEGLGAPRDVESGISFLRRFIQTNAEARFLNLQQPRDLKRPVFELSGWIDQHKIDQREETIYFLTGDTLKTILKQYDANAVVNELDARGCLMRSSERVQYKKKIPLPGSTETVAKWLYAIRGGALFDT